MTDVTQSEMSTPRAYPHGSRRTGAYHFDQAYIEGVAARDHDHAALAADQKAGA